MDLGIAGKTALVTGASAGIGRAIALELAQNGAHVALVARGAKRLADAAEEIGRECPVTVLRFEADVADPLAPSRVVDGVVKLMGAIDIVVNNAGRAHAGGLLSASDHDWQGMIDTKLSAMRRFCAHAVPYMRERKWGRIVNISSIGGIYPNPQLVVSHALSAAINNLTKSLALEVASEGILVNAVGVGAVRTDNWAANMLPNVRSRRPELASRSDDEVLEIIGAEMTPVGRVGLPEEIAAVVAFLASARNGFVTGDVVQASGGADRFM